MRQWRHDWRAELMNSFATAEACSALVKLEPQRTSFCIHGSFTLTPYRGLPPMDELTSTFAGNAIDGSAIGSAMTLTG